MPFIEWSARYLVNVQSIDEQHRQLVVMLNELYDAMVERRSADGVKRVVDRMNHYAKEHFSLEERYMVHTDYADYADHKAQHAEFVCKTRDLQVRLSDSRQVLSIEIVNYLREWLTNHILRTDQRLAVFLNERGIV
jgi:hemerythrin